MISPLWEVPVAISHIFSFTVYARAWWSAFMHPLTVWLSEKGGVYTSSGCSGFYTCKQWIWKWHMNSYYTLVSMCIYFDRKLQYSSGKWNQHHHPHRDTDRNICEPMACDWQNGINVSNFETLCIVHQSSIIPHMPTVTFCIPLFTCVNTCVNTSKMGGAIVFVWVMLEYGLFFLNCYEWCKFPLTQWSIDIILSKEPVFKFFPTLELYSVRCKKCKHTRQKKNTIFRG